MNGRLIIETYAIVKKAVSLLNVNTNHFEVLTEENPYQTTDSVRRQDEVERQKGNCLAVYKAYQIICIK